MRGVEIVNRLKEVVSKYTEDFSTIININSLSNVAGTITAVTATDHNLSTNDYVTISGAKEPIATSSVTRDGNVVTVTTLASNKLTDPSLYSDQANLPIYVELSGITPAEYNGTFELLTVPNDITFTYKISTTPASPATTQGTLLLSDFDGYNGYKQVTVVDPTTFTYTTTNTTVQSPAQGTIKVSTATNIANVATPTRILEYYDKNGSDGNLNNWMFVVMDQERAFRDGTIANDITSAKIDREDFYYEIMQDFSIYVIAPAKTSLLSGDIADTVRAYRQPILKAIANYQFASNLTDVTYQPATYVGNEADDYIKAYYVHRFDFTASGFVQRDDVADFNPGVPLELIDGTIADKDMTYNPIMRKLEF